MEEWAGHKLMLRTSRISDKLSQRCRMSWKLISFLGMQIGDLISITPKSSSSIHICVLWPLNNPLTPNVIEMDNSVTLNYNNDFLHSLDNGPISVLKYCAAKTVTVLITIVSIDELAKWIKNKLELAYFVKCILKQFYVVKGSTVHCVEHMLAKLCGIYNIIIEELDCSDAALVTEMTDLNIKKLVTKEWFYKQQSKEIYIGGLRKELENLKTLAIHSHKYHRSICLLIIGPSGVGKTTLVKKAARDLNAYLIIVSALDIARSDRNENERILRHIWKQAKTLSEEELCILLITEIEIICLKREQHVIQPADGMIALLSTLLDEINNKGNLIVIGETGKPDTIEPTFRRRFQQEIMIGVPDCFQREEIMISIARSNSIDISNINFKSLAERTPGYVGADLSLLFQEASLNSFRTKGSFPTTENIRMKDFELAFDTVKASTQKDCIWHMKVKPVFWEEIGGMDNIKQTIKQHIEWPLIYSKQFRKMGLPHPKGVLLQGPPGCCKTTLVQAAATSCNATFFAVTSAQIFSPYVGDSEKAIVELFHKARLGAPAIIFFDEIDTLVGKRGFGAHGGIHEKVLSTLLNEMDGIDGKSYHSVRMGSMEIENPNVVVVAATNRVDLIDEAILRPGRFDVIIDVPLPDKKLRESIFHVVASKMPIEGVDFKELALKTVGFSGADIKNLCHEAALQAICQSNFEVCPVTMENFSVALDKIQPSLNSDQIEFYERLSKKHNLNTWEL